MIGLLSLIAAATAHAATYNFYFNNSEQGANSTAKPTVIVNDDGKSATPEATPSPAPVSETIEPESAVEPVAALAEDSAARARSLMRVHGNPFDFSWLFAMKPSIEEKQTFRVALTALRNSGGYNGPTRYYTGIYGNPYEEEIHPISMTLSWFPHRRCGLNLNVGSGLPSTELQIVPIISPNNRLQIGLLAGIMNDGSEVRDVYSAGHVGLHGVFYFNSHIGFTAEVRKTVVATDHLDASQYGIGFQFRI